MLALFAWPNRLFSSEKIVKGEGSDKPKTQFSVFGYAGPTPVF